MPPTRGRTTCCSTLPSVRPAKHILIGRRKGKHPLRKLPSVPRTPCPCLPPACLGVGALVVLTLAVKGYQWYASKPDDSAFVQLQEDAGAYGIN